MSIGTSAYVLVCSSQVAEAAPCPAGTGPTYLESYLLTPGAAEWVNAASAPFELSTFVGFWGLSLTTVLLCWFIAFAAKQVIKAVH